MTTKSSKGKCGGGAQSRPTAPKAYRVRVAIQVESADPICPMCEAERTVSFTASAVSPKPLDAAKVAYGTASHRLVKEFVAEMDRLRDRLLERAAEGEPQPAIAGPVTTTPEAVPVV
jgi:hypothetical protein